MTNKMLKLLFISFFIYDVISQYSPLNTGCTTSLNTDTRSYRPAPMKAAWGVGSVQKAFVQDAPVGNVVFRSSSTYTLLHSDPIPANSLEMYRLRVFIRRTSNDSVLADELFFGACPMDSNKNFINNQGAICYYYYINKGDPKVILPFKKWVYYQFEVGAGTNVNLPTNTAYMSLGFFINYKFPSTCAKGTSTFQINGAQVAERQSNYQIKPSQIQCPENRTFELSVLTGFNQGSQSNALNLKLSFYDSNQNLLAVMPVRWGTCNYFQSGNIDTVKACANWVQKVASMKVSVSLSDELQVESMTVAFGSRIATKSQFWLDDTGQGTSIDGWPVYTNLQFKV